MDLNKAKKVLLDHWHLNFSPLFFYFGFTAGPEDSVFLLNPQAAKGFNKTLQEYIEKYEAAHGEIDMKGYETGIQSPIQLG